MKFFLTIFLLLITLPGKGWTQEIPKVLNTDFRKAQKSRLVFSPFIGPYIGDTVSTSYIVGSQLAYNWSRHFATAVDFGFSPLEFDPQSVYGATVTNKKLYHLNGALMGVVPAAVKVSHHKVLEMDLYGLLGGGWLKINRSNRANGFAGIGALMYLKPPWFAFRAEARTYVYKLPIARGGMSVDAAILVGPTFLIAPAVF